MKTASLPSTSGKAKTRKVGELVGQYIAAHGSGIPGGWSVQFPWTGGIIKAEGGPEEVVELIAATLRANGEPANTDEIAKWCLQHFWLHRAGPQRWKQKFEANGSKVKLQSAKPEKLHPKDYGRALWEIGNVLLAMKPKKRPLLLAAWLQITMALLSDEDVGCDECLGHANEFLAVSPIKDEYTDEQMRVWMWLFHDNASQKAGNHRQPYDRVARHWRWPALTEEEFNRIKESL